MLHLLDSLLDAKTFPPTLPSSTLSHSSSSLPTITQTNSLSNTNESLASSLPSSSKPQSHTNPPPSSSSILSTSPGNESFFSNAFPFDSDTFEKDHVKESGSKAPSIPWISVEGKLFEHKSLIHPFVNPDPSVVSLKTVNEGGGKVQNSAKDPHTWKTSMVRICL